MYKYIIMFIICTFLNVPTEASYSVEKIKQVSAISNAIVSLQPVYKTDTERLERLSEAIWSHSRTTGIDWRIALAIMHQESSLQMDPQNCLKKKRCNDMGIGQIRYSIWGKTLGIDTKLLLTNEFYAVGKVFQVLEYYKLQFENRELNWFTRYHSGTPSHRHLYMSKLNRAYKQLNVPKD